MLFRSGSGASGSTPAGRKRSGQTGDHEREGFGHPNRWPVSRRNDGPLSWQSTGTSARKAASWIATAVPGEARPCTRPRSIRWQRRCVRSESNPSRLLMAAVSLSVSTVKPLGDRIFIKVSESEERTAGGILQIGRAHV